MQRNIDGKAERIDCEKCGPGHLEQPEPGAQYECTHCEAVVSVELARCHGWNPK